MSNIRFSKRIKKGTGFYVALGICLAAIGVAAFVTYNNFTQFVEDGSGTSNSINKNNKQEIDEFWGSNTHQNQNSEFESSINFPEDDYENSSTQTLEVQAENSGIIVFPAGKNIIKNYSGENPVFSKTFNDWRIHNGIDFGVEQDAKIQSITDGKVKEIYDDMLMGKTIVIEHDPGFTAFYSGFGDNITVNIGDTVTSGQEIGAINNVPAESAEGHHLHLSIKKDGKFINPTDILGE